MKQDCKRNKKIKFYFFNGKHLPFIKDFMSN